jgi:hypothetical protein
MLHKNANPAVGVGGVRQEFQILKPASNSPATVETQAIVIAADINNNNRRYGRPIFSNRVRLIGILGFRRRRRWRGPFSSEVFKVVRRELSGAVE